MNMKSYKVKLKVNTELESLLKRSAGVYRKIYNLCLNAQEYRVTVNSPKNHFISGSQLEKIIKKDLFNSNPFLKHVDKGIIKAAINVSTRSFKLKFNYRPGSTPYLSKKNSDLKFRTCSPVKVMKNFVSIPKIGNIPLCECERIPYNQSYTNASISYDGVDWYLSVSYNEPCILEVPLGKPLFVDFSNNGCVILNGVKNLNLIENESLKIEEYKYKTFIKKYKRQTKTNKKVVNSVTVYLNTKNKQKTKKKIDKSKIKLYNIKRDSFCKLIHEVAKPKPKELHILSNSVIKRKRNNYLSRSQRRLGSREFFNSLKKKLSVLGTQIVRHSSIESFLEALGSRDYDCGGTRKYPTKAEACLSEAVNKSRRNETWYRNLKNNKTI